MGADTAAEPNAGRASRKAERPAGPTRGRRARLLVAITVVAASAAWTGTGRAEEPPPPGEAAHGLDLVAEEPATAAAATAPPAAGTATDPPTDAPTPVLVERRRTPTEDHSFDVTSDGWLHLASASNLRHHDLTGFVPNPQVLSPLVATDVAAGPDDTLYVPVHTPASPTVSPATDALVQRRSTDGTTVLSTFDRTGQAGTYVGADVDEDGNVYVAEARRQVCTQHHPATGCTQTTLLGTVQLVRFAADGTSTVLVTGGSDPESVFHVSDVAVGAGLVHVAERDSDRVQTFTTDGTYVRTTPVASPADLAVGPDGILYVVSAADESVYGYDTDGGLRVAWSLPDEAHGGEPLLVAVHPTDGRIYVGTYTFTYGYERRGTLAGTVVEDASGEPVEGAFVVAMDATTLAFGGGSRTGPAGTYELALPTGDHVVQVHAPGSHASEWVEDQPAPASLQDLTSFTVAPEATATADASLAPTTGSIVGTVTEVGAGPVAGAWVVAVADGRPSALATTAADGAYALEGLPEGDHRVVALDPGGEHAPRFVGDTTDPSLAELVAVAGGDQVVRDLALPAATAPTPAGAVTGEVVDDASDAAIEGAAVVALTESLQPVGATLTDAAGAFSLPIADTPHHLEVFDPSGRHALEWFDDVEVPQTLADLDAVEPGDEVAVGLAPRTGTVHGEVLGGSAPLAGAWVFLVGDDGVAAGAVTDADGAFEIAGVAPGDYLVAFVAPAGGHRNELHADATSPGAAQLLTVAAGSPTWVDADLDVAVP